MKLFYGIGAITLIAFMSENLPAATTCDALGSRLKASEIDSKFTGQLVCAEKIGAASGNDRWAEEHRASKELWEQGKGTTSKVHPPHKVGTWSTIADAKDQSGKTDRVAYKYTGGSSFEWSVFEKSGVYTFCTTDETKVIAKATVKAPNPTSTNACGF